MGKPIDGSDLMLFIGTGSGQSITYKSIAFATSHKLSMSAETVETSSKDSGGKWVSKAVRKLSWNMSTDNLFSLDGEGSTYDDLFDLMTGRKEIDVVFRGNRMQLLNQCIKVQNSYVAGQCVS